MANKKISQLFENAYPRTGDIFPIVQDGITYKVTLDNLSRLNYDEYFVTHNLDPYILDDLSNAYGRYRFISGNLMISGKGNNAHLPHPGSCVLRLYDGNFILNGTGIISGLNGGHTELGHTNNTVGVYNLSIGQFNLTTGNYNEIFGHTNYTNGINIKIIGSGNSITGNDSDIVGKNNYGYLINSDIVGKNNYITGINLEINGHNNTLNSREVKIFGNYNTGKFFSSGSFIVGQNNYVGNEIEAGANSLIYGDLNRVSGKNTLVYGRNNLIQLKSNALEKISVYGLENNISGIEVDIYGRLNFNAGLTNQIYGHSNTGSGDVNFILGDFNQIQKPVVESYLLGDSNIVYNGSGNFIIGKRNQGRIKDTQIFGDCIIVSGTGNWLAGRDSYYTGVDILSVGRDIKVNNYGDFSNIFGRGNTIDGSGYYSEIYGTDNINKGWKVLIVGKNNTADIKSSEASIIGRLNRIQNEKIFIVGENNQANKPRAYIFGYYNTNGASSGYIFGQTNTLDGDNDNSYIFGRSNYIVDQIYNTYTFGFSNFQNANNSILLGNNIRLNDFGNGGYKLPNSDLEGAMQIGVNNSGKITILKNGNIGIGTQTGVAFENPQELIHVRSGNVLFDATQGGYFKFYDKNQYNNIPDNPSQVNQFGDIRAIVSGGNFKIDGDLVLSTGYGENGQFLAGRIFQEATITNLDGTMWCYKPSDINGNCDNASANPYNNSTESIIGTDNVTYTHKVGLWQPTGLDIGWNTPGSPIINYPYGYNSGYAANILVKDGAIAKPDFCNGDCNYDYQPHESGRLSGAAIAFLDGNPISTLINNRYTLVNVPIMKTTNLYLPLVSQNSGVVYTVKNLGKGNIMVFTQPNEKIDLFFGGFMIDQRFASYEFLSNGSGWFLV